MLGSTNSDVVLEVYHLPRDVWLKEIEDVKSKMIESEHAKNTEPVPPAETDTAVGRFLF